MNKEAIENELREAYVKLERAEKTINNLLDERRNDHQVIEVLKAAGFLTEEKIRQARDILMG